MDQDALDFMKKFFSFQDPQAVAATPPENEIFFRASERLQDDDEVDLSLQNMPKYSQSISN